jgi:hypothetical protein
VLRIRQFGGHFKGTAVVFKSLRGVVGFLLEQPTIEVAPAVSGASLEALPVGLASVVHFALVVFYEPDPKPRLVQPGVYLERFAKHPHGIIGIATVEKHDPEVDQSLGLQLVALCSLPVIQDGLIARVIGM